MNVRLLLAVLLPFATFGLQLLLWEDWIKPHAWPLFWPAAFLGAWLCGFRGGVLVTLISALLVSYAFVPPYYSLAVALPSSVFAVTSFVLFGIFFSYVFERLRRAGALDRSGFDAVFEQAAVGVALVSPDGHWLRVNRKLCEIVGYSRQELTGMSFQEITYAEDLDTDLENVRRMLVREIDSYALEKRYIRKSGELVWINLTVGLAWKADGTPDYFISVVEDISARKAAEAALAENERRLREAGHLAQLGHWYWDVVGNEHRWSEEIYRIYGHDPALPPAVYPQVQAFFTPASWQQLSAAVTKCRADGSEYECDAEVLRPDGEHRWITARGTAIRNARGEVIAMHGTVQDITSRKLAEDELQRRNAELELFNQASVGRELRMLELKREVNALTWELGREAPYDLSFADAGPPASAP